MQKEARITCRKCGRKFSVKVGRQKSDCERRVFCPACRLANHFFVDKKGKVHGLAQQRRGRSR